MAEGVHASHIGEPAFTDVVDMIEARRGVARVRGPVAPRPTSGNACVLKDVKHAYYKLVRCLMFVM